MYALYIFWYEFIDFRSGYLDFSDFCLVMGEKNKEFDPEIHYKDTFKVFSKDDEGEDHHSN